MTFGTAWAEMFTESLARQLAGIIHWDLGNPNFQLNHSDCKYFEIETNEKDFLNRINSPSAQASELLWRFQQLVRASTVVLLDTKILDTAIGQHILHTTKVFQKPAWAVGVDAKTSPLAPAYLKGVFYPATADDLVKLVLQEAHGE